jgi:F-type H+-transporting ATPase subunit b
MLIDWFTVIAQTINFLVLVWLLKRYLYKPVLEAIDERDRSIAARIREGEAKKAEAEGQFNDFQHKNAEFERDRQEMYNSALGAAKAERERLIEEARQESVSMREKHLATLRNEQHDLAREITRRTQEEVFAITRQALADLAAASLEDQMAEVLMRRLRELETGAKEQLAAALRSAAGPVVVRSAFELPPARQAGIEKILREGYHMEVPVEFEIRPEQVSGIELAVNGYKLAWSIADYLSVLEKNITELIKAHPAGEAAPNAGAST